MKIERKYLAIWNQWDYNINEITKCAIPSIARKVFNRYIDTKKTVKFRIRFGYTCGQKTSDEFLSCHKQLPYFSQIVILQYFDPGVFSLHSPFMMRVRRSLYETEYAKSNVVQNHECGSICWKSKIQLIFRHADVKQHKYSKYNCTTRADRRIQTDYPRINKSGQIQ